MDVSLVSVCDPLATPLLVRAFPFVIGRGEDCDLRLNNVLVSRRHAELRMVRGRLRAYDCGSLNGTSVNGRLAGRKGIELRDGDHLGVATTVFLVRTIAAAESGRRNAGDPAPAQTDAKMSALGESPLEASGRATGQSAFNDG